VCIQNLEEDSTVHDNTLLCLLLLLNACDEDDDELSLDVGTTEWLDNKKLIPSTSTISNILPFVITPRKQLIRWYSEQMEWYNKTQTYDANKAHLQNQWALITSALVKLRERSTQNREAIHQLVLTTVCQGIAGVASIVFHYVFRLFVSVY
jgi:hypothetical protein